MSDEQEQVEIYIQENMDVPQRAELEMKLEHERGIVRAWFEEGAHHHLCVIFEPEHFSHGTLLNTIEGLGFHGEVVGA